MKYTKLGESDKQGQLTEANLKLDAKMSPNTFIKTNILL